MIEFIRLDDQQGDQLNIRADSVVAVGPKLTGGCTIDTTGGHTYYSQQNVDFVLQRLEEALARQQEADYAGRTRVGMEVLGRQLGTHHPPEPINPYEDEAPPF